MADTSIQTIVGAVDFDGLTAATGRVTFDPEDIAPGMRAHILSVSYFGASVSTGATLTLVDERTGAVATSLQRIRTLGGGFRSFYFGCFQVPPRFRFELVTTGKSGDGTLILDWSPTIFVPNPGTI